MKDLLPERFRAGPRERHFHRRSRHPFRCGRLEQARSSDARLRCKRETLATCCRRHRPRHERYGPWQETTTGTSFLPVTARGPSGSPTPTAPAACSIGSRTRSLAVARSSATREAASSASMDATGVSATRTPFRPGTTRSLRATRSSWRLPIPNPSAVRRRNDPERRPWDAARVRRKVSFAGRRSRRPERSRRHDAHAARRPRATGAPACRPPPSGPRAQRRGSLLERRSLSCARRLSTT